MNLLRAGWSMLRSRLVSRPNPAGTEHFDASDLDPILRVVAERGVDGLGSIEDQLSAYLERASLIDPDRLDPDNALAYWINLYNAAALDLSRRTRDAGYESVLELRTAFTAPVITIAGEQLSLDGIEHGKVRRFGDARIHAALVCGSLSCPTLRHEAYRASDIDAQLDDQMRHFVTAGGAVANDQDSTIELSRIFLWYGADFVRPHRMPALLPTRPRSIVQAIRPWLDPETRAWVDATDPSVSFQDYDWTLACAVRKPETT